MTLSSVRSCCTFWCWVYVFFESFSGLVFRRAGGLVFVDGVGFGLLCRRFLGLYFVLCGFDLELGVVGGVVFGLLLTVGSYWMIFCHFFIFFFFREAF